MDLALLALILAVLIIGTYVFLFGFLKKVNDWLYVRSLGDEKHSLPPGDMGWPIFGNTWSFLKAFKSKDPDTFIYNLVSWYGRTGIYKTYLFGSPSIIVSIPETCRKVLTDDERFRFGDPHERANRVLEEMRNVALKVIAHIFVGSGAKLILGFVEKYYTDFN
ncbi:hypothetical protein PTKIN_Ptkin05aG0015200 [Pterospermum kingtungense]